MDKQVLDCSSSDSTLKNYNEILEAQKNNLRPSTRYTLEFIAICIGKYDDGLKHMHRASEGKHVAATRILGKYYKNNQSFDSAQKPSMKNRYTAITYYKKAADQIESISSYPRPGMEYLEYVNTISYRVFTALPGLYFRLN